MTQLGKILAEDYRGTHQAPGKNGDDAPLHNLKGIYPDDFYTGKAHEYAGNEPGTGEAVSIMLSCKGKPKARVKVYRAVPKIPSHEEKIQSILKQKAYIQKTGKVPKEAPKFFKNSSECYEALNEELEELQKLSPEKEEKIGINPGDWVSISKAYVVDHGRSNLDNKYRIISKTVPASSLWTDGNSVCEWGYDP